jgi:hypothetical protein
LSVEDYINPQQHVVGVLRTYGKSKGPESRKEYIVTPSDLGLSKSTISKYTSKGTDDLAEEQSFVRLRTDVEASATAGQDLYRTA